MAGMNFDWSYAPDFQGEDYNRFGGMRGGGTGRGGGYTARDAQRWKEEAYAPEASPYGASSNTKDPDWARRTYNDMYEQFKARNPGLDFNEFDDQYFPKSLGINDINSSNDIAQIRYAMEGFRPPAPRQPEPAQSQAAAPAPPAEAPPEAPPPAPSVQLPAERKIEDLAGDPLGPETGKPKDAQKQEFLNRFLGGVDPSNDPKPDTTAHLWEAYKSQRDASYEAMLGSGADYNAGFGGRSAGEYLKQQDERRMAWDESQRRESERRSAVDPRKFLDSILYGPSGI